MSNGVNEFLRIECGLLVTNFEDCQVMVLFRERKVLTSIIIKNFV